ncbi:MAG: TadE/TadG family type IV pilus assembly protein [Comamonas sp.]
MKSDRRQYGVSAIEFALAFPLMFLIFYGIVTYALVFLVQHTMSNAAAESARTLLRYQSLQNDTAESRIEMACQSVEKNMQWLVLLSGDFACGSGATGEFSFEIKGEVCGNGLSADYTCFSVSGSYPYENKPLIPTIPFLPIPSNLNAHAETQVKLKI